MHIRTHLFSTALATAVLLLVPATTSAGGFDVRLETDSETYTVREDKPIKVSLTLKFRGCVSSLTLPAATEESGPKVTLESRNKANTGWAKHVWAPVSKAPRSYDAGIKSPFRLDVGNELKFSKWLQLAPGTYRLKVVIASKPVGTMEIFSQAFEVVRAASTSAAGTAKPTAATRTGAVAAPCPCGCGA
jgi:hypothetical protein